MKWLPKRTWKHNGISYVWLALRLTSMLIRLVKAIRKYFFWIASGYLYTVTLLFSFQAFNPLLDVYLKPSVTNATNTSLEVSNKSLSTPVRSAQQKNDVSASTPKSPYNVSSKTKLLAAEMLLQLFTEKKDRQQSRALKLGKRFCRFTILFRVLL